MRDRAHPDWPRPDEFPDFYKNFGPRGVLHSYADGRIEDTGPLSMKRMETVDDEFLEAAEGFIRAQESSDTPFFVWFNTSHMHFRTHVKPESRGQAGRWQSVYHDTMIDHDKVVGSLLDLLDTLGIADDTIVLYGTDNGPHMNSWPDAGMTWFRSEKDTNWEGAFRTPALVRWPGHIATGSISNEIVSHLDWLPTFLAAAGDPDIAAKLERGHQATNKTFHVHLDGYNLVPYLTGLEEEGPRKSFFYFSDDGDLVAVRYDHWKLVFVEQRAIGTLAIWAEPFTHLHVPKMYNLRTDPFERADLVSNTYWDWLIDHEFLALPAQKVVGDFLATFIEFPPRQKAASFNLDIVLEKLQHGLGSH